MGAPFVVNYYAAHANKGLPITLEPEAVIIQRIVPGGHYPCQPDAIPLL